jgi:hypothetical protein
MHKVLLLKVHDVVIYDKFNRDPGDHFFCNETGKTWAGY